MLTNQDFFDPEFWKFMQQDFQNIRERRKKLKGPPDAYDRIIMDSERSFESFYKHFLK